MIGNKDIEKILVKDLSTLIGVEDIFVADDMPEGIIEKERIVVISKPLSIAKIFNKSYTEVNWCVPDIGDYPAHERLGEVSRHLLKLSSVGEYDGTAYRYEVSSIGVVASELKCHYVNARLLFEILNVN